MLDRRSFVSATIGAAALAGLPASSSATSLYPAPDRQLMVPVEGGRIYVRVNGDLAGPRLPLLMIHGGPGGNHASFLAALPLAQERAIILYDQLDSGRSDRPNNPANWRVPRFVDEVDAVRKALKLERLHVLGHSWGGTVALEYAARRPAGLGGTILASPLISTRSWIADANRLVGRLPADVRKTIAACDGPHPPAEAVCQGADKAFYAQFLTRRPRDAEISAYSRALGFNERLYREMWGRSEFVSTGSLRSYDGEPLLARLDGSRTLFMDGQYDEAQPPTLLGFSLRVPGSSFATIEDSGHGLWNDNPEAANALLRRWLARQERA